MKNIHIVKYILLLVIILTISAWLIILANGYKINPRTHKLEKTGMIYLSSTPSNSNVYINGELKTEQTPYKLRDIFPQRYDIKISKDGFSDWQETLHVEPEAVAERKYVVLFYKKLQEIILTPEEQASYKKILESNQESWIKNLFIKDENELWFGDVLVTRLSDEIKQVRWYDDLQHIIYHIEGSINIMDVNGTNIIKLVEIPNTKTANFISVDNGESLIYQVDDNIYKIKLTQNNGLINDLKPNILK